MTTALFHVPPSGMIERVAPDRARQLAAMETPETMDHFHTQMQRLADSRIDVHAAQPAVAGGLILGCDERDISRAYEAAFKVGSVQQTAKVIPFPASSRNSGALCDAFRDVAPRFRLDSAFARVARTSLGLVPSVHPALRAA
jgi:hypothetical protein